MTTQGIKKILANNDDQLDRLGKAIDAAVEQTVSLKADLEQALALLEKHEFAAEFHMEGVCPECVNDAVYDLQVGRRWSGHAPDCTWANLLSKYNREVKYCD